MHMSDALVSPPVGLAMLAISAGTIAITARNCRRSFDEKRIPLSGVAGAFVFAAQMLNFAIPGTGASGHIAGGVLLGALLGPSPAFIALTCVLIVQALFFADGGLLALGCNIFNMGFVGCLLAAPYIFRPIAGDMKKPWRVFLGAVAAAVASMELGALAVTIQTTLSGVTALPFSTFAMAMLPIHLVIGAIEGIATGTVLLFLQRHLPEFNRLPGRQVAQHTPAAVLGVLGVAALVFGGGLSLLASSSPDGLEWSLERVAGTAELPAEGGVYQFFAQLAEKVAVLPDYALPNQDTPWGTVLAGVAGVMLFFVLAGGLRFMCNRMKKDAPQEANS